MCFLCTYLKFEVFNDADALNENVHPVERQGVFILFYILSEKCTEYRLQNEKIK